MKRLGGELTFFGGQYSPVSGDVVEVNEALNDQPGLINKYPEDKGAWRNEFLLFTGLKRFLAWLCKIAITKPGEVRYFIPIISNLNHNLVPYRSGGSVNER